MRTICLYFQIHQPFRLRKYRFFDIGSESYYYDDYLNESICRKVAENSYLPANKIIKELIKKNDGKFKVSFSISGIALDQFQLYAPEVIESFQELAQTGHVEFLSETYAHSLVSLKNKDEFVYQVQEQKSKIQELFGFEPRVFRNTELIYSDEIGAIVADMGFRGMLTEGAKHILGWKSPNYLYANAINPKLKILLKNFKLSDDIAFRFSNKGWSDYPLTTEKFVGWLNQLDKKEETVNLFMDYETFGEHQWKDTGIFEFLEAFPATVFSQSKFSFSTPSELIDELQPISAINVPYPISWADEERDVTAWLGNPLQEQAFQKLYALYDKVARVNDPKIKKNYQYLQLSDHFYYMCTKFFSDGDVHSYFNPYETPYEAFINYMNVLSDFEIRLNAAVAEEPDNEVVKLSKIISEKDEIIQKYEKQILAFRKANVAPKTKFLEDAELKAGAKRKTVKKSVKDSNKKTVTASKGSSKKTIPTNRKKPTTGKSKSDLDKTKGQKN